MIVNVAVSPESGDVNFSVVVKTWAICARRVQQTSWTCSRNVVKWARTSPNNNAYCLFLVDFALDRPAQIAELPRSKFDPELFPHSAYVEIFVTFATKVPYLTFCNKMWRILMKEMERGGGNGERMRKCRESISPHFLIFSPFPPHFLILSPFPRSPAATIRAALVLDRP